MVNLDQLSIQITASTQSANKKVQTLTESLSNLVVAINKIDTTKFDKLASSADALSQGLSGIKGSTVKQITKVAEAIDNVKAQGNSFEGVAEGAEKLNNATEKVTTSVGQVAKAISGISSAKIDSLAQSTEGFTERIDSASKNSMNLRRALANIKVFVPTDSLKEVEKKFDSVKAKVQELREQMEWKSNRDTEYVDSKEMERDKVKIEGLISEMERLKLKKQELESHGGFRLNVQGLVKAISLFKELGKHILSTTKKVGSLLFNFSGIPTFISLAKKGLSSIKSKIDNVFKSLTRVYKMMRLMVLRKILQAVIKNAIEGFTNLIQYSDNFNASVSLLWNSMRQLGNSIAAAVSPLINALAPALNVVIQKVIEAINWVNQLISAFTGLKTWTKAKTLSDDYGKSLEKTGKAAKKLNKQLQGFDALNNLTTQDDSGNALTKAKDMFEEVPITKKINDLLDWLKKMWELGDFYDLGALLGQKLKNWLDSIPWNQIRETANKLGKCLATFLNGFIEVEGLGNSIGRTFAESLNTIFEFLNGFVKNFNWDSFGKFIADTFNGFFENIDWELIKETVVSGFEGLAESINAFIENFHWENISNTISNIVNILTEAIYTFFSETDFGALGTKIGEQIEQTIEKIDWKQIGQTIGVIIHKAVEFCSNLISELKWSEIKNAISELLEGIFSEASVSDIAKAITAILSLSLITSIPGLLVKVGELKLGSTIASKIFAEKISSSVVDKMGGTLGGAIESSTKTPAFTGKMNSIGNAIGIMMGVAIGAQLGEKLANLIGTAIGDEDYKNYKLGDGLKSIAERLHETVFADDDTKSFNKYSEVLQEIKDGTKYTYLELDKLSEKYQWNNSQVMILKNTLYGYGVQNSETAKKVEETANAIQKSTEKISAAPNNVTEGINKLKTTTESLGRDSGQSFAEYANNFNVMEQNTKTALDGTAKGANAFKTEVVANLSSADISTSAENFGKNIGDGVGVGIAEADTDTASQGFFSRLWDSICRVFGIASPAKQMYPIGNYITLGIIEGFKEKFVEFNKTATEFINKVKSFFTADKWTFNGIKQGLQNSFNSAINAIKNIWNSFANALNQRLRFTIPSINAFGRQISSQQEINLGRIPTFSTGGFPEDGLFMANSRELVGEFSNGKTAVANNEQIINGIASGVSSAMAEQNTILLQQNSLLRELVEKDFGISENDLFKSVQSSANSYQKRTGKYAFS